MNDYVTHGTLRETDPRLIEKQCYEDIEEDWRWAKLGDISEVQSGTSGSQTENETKLPVSRIETISDGTFDADKVNYLENPEKDYERFQYQYGDLIFSNINSGKHIGKTAIFELKDKRICHGMNLLRVHAMCINSFYLYQYFNSGTQKKIWYRVSQPAVNQCSINKSMLTESRIQIPPLPEQGRIASVLYSVDEHVRTLDNRHDKLTDHKQALMQDLLTGVKRVAPDMTVLDTISEHQSEIEEDKKNKPSICLDDDMGKNPDGSASYSRPTWSGAELPEGWSCKTVSQECEIQGGKAFSGDRFSKRYQESGCPLVKRATVNNKRPPVQFLRGDFDDRYSVEKGDILVSMDGNFNSLLWGFGDAALNQRVCSINPNDTSFNNYFLSHAIKMPLQFTEDSTGATTVKSLSVNDFDYIEIPTPELWEQERIASVLYTVDEMIARMASLRDEYERLKQGLMQDLLSGDVRTPEALRVDETVVD